MSLDAFNKIDNAQALLSVLTELFKAHPFCEQKSLGFGVYLNIQQIDKILSEAKATLRRKNETT